MSDDETDSYRTSSARRNLSARYEEGSSSLKDNLSCTANATLAMYEQAGGPTGQKQINTEALYGKSGKVVKQTTQVRTAHVGTVGPSGTQMYQTHIGQQSVGQMSVIEPLQQSEQYAQNNQYQNIPMQPAQTMQSRHLVQTGQPMQTGQFVQTGQPIQTGQPGQFMQQGQSGQARPLNQNVQATHVVQQGHYQHGQPVYQGHNISGQVMQPGIQPVFTQSNQMLNTGASTQPGRTEGTQPSYQAATQNLGSQMMGGPQQPTVATGVIQQAQVVRQAVSTASSTGSAMVGQLTTQHSSIELMTQPSQNTYDTISHHSTTIPHSQSKQHQVQQGNFSTSDANISTNNPNLVSQSSNLSSSQATGTIVTVPHTPPSGVMVQSSGMVQPSNMMQQSNTVQPGDILQSGVPSGGLVIHPDVSAAISGQELVATGLNDSVNSVSIYCSH